MNIKYKLNKKILILFKHNFKKELDYYNNSGIIYWSLQNTKIYLEPFFNKPLENIFSDKEINEIDKNFYLKDFVYYIQNYNDYKCSFSVNKLYYEENSYLNKISSFLESLLLLYNSILEEKNEPKLYLYQNNNIIYSSMAINYIMFLLLMKNNFIESKFIESNTIDYINDRINDIDIIDDEPKIYLD